MQGNCLSCNQSYCPQSVMCVLCSHRLRSTGLYSKKNSRPAKMTTLLLVFWFEYGVSTRLVNVLIDDLVLSWRYYFGRV